jgi:hypothetical protein
LKYIRDKARGESTASANHGLSRPPGGAFGSVRAIRSMNGLLAMTDQSQAALAFGMWRRFQNRG